jgi:ArsR family transcriptional regulator
MWEYDWQKVSSNGEDRMNALTQIFKLLSDETRLRILSLLYLEDLCVCQLSGILNVPQPSVSKSLSKMRDLDLVADERSEKFVFYSLKRQNRVLMATLQNITEDLESYPQLITDRERLDEKETFLNQCCSLVNK